MWNNTVVAEAPNEELVRIEGNWYFPPRRLHEQYFRSSDHKTFCPWKGEASYYDIVVDDEVNDFGAWYYAEPQPGAAERVKQDFAGYVAFWHGVEVVD